jgi:hypothetical protein
MNPSLPALRRVANIASAERQVSASRSTARRILSHVVLELLTKLRDLCAGGSGGACDFHCLKPVRGRVGEPTPTAHR